MSVGKILSGSSNVSRSTRLNEAEGLSFLKNGGVTYVTEQWVTTQCELFLLFEFNFCNRQLFWLRITLHYYRECMAAVSKGS
jgi:hypothetical protein